MAETPEGRAQLAEWRKNAIGKQGRPKGATDGMSAYRRNKMIAKARAEAKDIVKHMEDKGIAIPKDEYAREAMTSVVELMRRTDTLPKDKLAAARTVLEWTIAKPAAETNVTVKKAEDFLSEIAEDMTKSE